MLTLLVALALGGPAHAEDLKLRFHTPPEGLAVRMRCTLDQERRQGPQTSTTHAEIRVVNVVAPVGNRWSMGTRELTVLAATSEPPPPPGVPPLEVLLTRLEPQLPHTLVNARGRWKGLGPYDPDAIRATFDQALAEAGMPEAFAARLRPVLGDVVNPEGLEARAREAWYAYTGHWLGRKLTVGASSIDEAAGHVPFPKGTTLTTSALGRVQCGPGGPTACERVRLAARLPDAAVRAQTEGTIAAVAGAAGLAPGDITYVGGSSTTTWTLDVEPETLRAWRTERRRVTDAELQVGGQSIQMGSSQTSTCVTE